MPKGHLEHANLTVSDPQRSADLLIALLGWEERWRGPSQMGGETIHVGDPGNGSSYVALYTNDDVRGEGARGYSKGQPLNHLGFVVDDLAAAEKNLTRLTSLCEAGCAERDQLATAIAAAKTARD